MCNNCIHKAVCSIYRATGGVKKCEHFKEERMGKWLKTTESLGWGDVLCGECSNCHESFIVDEEDSFDDFAMWKYCPNCGADMMEGPK